ncbi:hypothetical protein HKD37_11G031465 [Glycine soja]
MPLSLAHQWAKRGFTAKCSFNVLSATEESGRASISRPRAKHEISALSAIVVFSKAQCTTDALSSNPLTRAKRKGGAKHNVTNSEPI